MVRIVKGSSFSSQRKAHSQDGDGVSKIVRSATSPSLNLLVIVRRSCLGQLNRVCSKTPILPSAHIHEYEWITKRWRKESCARVIGWRNRSIRSIRSFYSSTNCSQTATIGDVGQSSPSSSELTLPVLNLRLLLLMWPLVWWCSAIVGK